MKRRALIALLLLVPVPTLGVVTLLFVLPGAEGKIIAFVGKAWIALLPLVWHIRIDKQKLTFPRPTMRGMGAAVISGTAFFIAMLAAYWLMRGQIDVEPLRAKAAATGFDRKGAYIAMFVYIIAVNSLLEEYVWRWFVFSKWYVLTTGVGRGWLAVGLAAACFTIHHIVALRAQFGWSVTVIASSGVFIGGAVWSWCYLRYESIWPGYISHAIVDLAVFVVGWLLLFG